jgi:flagellar biogenesis protein FliO
MPKTETKNPGQGIGGLAGWLLSRLHPSSRPRPSLTLLERITLAPRQSLSLVEAEGRKFLIATSAEGAPAFYALNERGPDEERARRARMGVRVRASW